MSFSALNGFNKEDSSNFTDFPGDGRAEKKTPPFISPLTSELALPLKNHLSLEQLLKALSAPRLQDNDPQWLDRCKIELDWVEEALDLILDGCENDLHSIDQLEAWLEQQKQKLQKRSLFATQQLIDRAEKILLQLQSVKKSLPECITIQQQVQEIFEQTDQSLEAWHKMRTSEFGQASKVVDPSLTCFKEMALHANTLMSIYSKAKNLPISLKLQLLRSIAEHLKILADEEYDFRYDMLSTLTSDLQNALSALSKANRTQEALIFSLKKSAPLSCLFDAYQDLKKAQANFIFFQKKCKESDDGQSVGAALAIIEKTLANIDIPAIPSKGFISSFLETFLHPIQTLLPNAEQQLAIEEERVFQSLVSIRNSFHKDRDSLHSALIQSEKIGSFEKIDSEFFARCMNLDPHGEALALLLKRPFIEKAKVGIDFDQINQREYLDGQKQLALILSIESILPQNASPQLRVNVQSAKEIAIKALGIDPPKDPIQFYVEVVQSEEQLQIQESISEWQKREIEFYQEMQKPNDSRIRNLWLFLFIPLQLGAWAYGCKQMLDQGALIHKQGMLHRWENELTKRGYTEKLPSEWQNNPEYTKAWLSALHLQMSNMSDQEFDKNLGKMPNDCNLRQMVINWRAEVKNDPTQLQKHSCRSQRQTPLISAINLSSQQLTTNLFETNQFETNQFETNQMPHIFDLQTSAAATNEFFLTSIVKKMFGWFSPYEPNPNEQELIQEALVQELDQYQTRVEQLEKSIQDYEWHYQYDDLLKSAIKTGHGLTKDASSLQLMSEIERKLAVTKIYDSLNSTIETLKPICSEIQTLKELHFRLLIEKEPLAVDDSLLQHIVLSHSQEGVGTGLEGYNPILMLEHHLKVMARIANSLACQPLCNHAQKKFCETCIGHPLDLTPEQECQLFQALQKKMETALFVGKAYQSSYDEFRLAIRKSLSMLKEGESFFFQGGWSKIGSREGHSVVYEIIKQKAQGYTFRIYNRGEGIDNLYSSAVIGEKIRWLPFIEVVDVQEDKIINPLLLKALQEPRNPPPYGKDWSPYEVTLMILHYLDGRESSNYYTSDQMMEEFSVGHCSFLSLDASIGQHLGSPVRRERWNLELEFSTIWDYYRGSEKNTILLEKALRQFARDVQFGFKKGIVSPDELQFLQRKMEEIEKDIQEQKKEKVAQHVAGATRKALVPSASTPWSAKISESSLERKDPKTIKIEPYTHLLDQNWTFSPTTFHDDLQRLLFHISVTQHSPLVVKETIRDFVAKIPLQCSEKSIEQCMSDLWSKLTPKYAEETLRDLALLGQEFIHTFHKIENIDNTRYFKVHPREILIQAKIFTLADSLSRKFKISFGLELPNLLEESLWTFLDGSRPYNDLKDDPAAAQDRANLEIYWNQMSFPNYQTSFFRLENFSKEQNGVIDDYISSLKDLPPNTDVAFASQWLLSHPKEKQTIATYLKQYWKGTSSLIEGYVALGSNIRIFQPNEEYGVELSNTEACKLLPSSFYHLRSLAMQTHALIGESLCFKESMDPLITIRESKQIRITIFIPGFNSGLGSGLGYKPQYKIENSVRTIPLSLSPFFYDTVQHQNVWLEIDLSTHRLRIAPHERQLKATIAHFSAEISQELLALSSVPQLQVRKTLSFFEQNKILLQRKDYQLVFETLLLEKNYLFEEFINHPEEAEHLANMMATLFKDQIDFYKKIHDILTVNFFLRLNEKVELIWKYAKTKSKSLGISPFENSRDHWKQLIDESLKTKERAWLWAELAISLAHDNPLTNKAVIELLSAQIYFSWYGPTAEDPLWSNEQEEARRDLLIKKRDAILSCLSDQKRRDEVLNKVVCNLTQENLSEQWFGDFPFFTTERKNIGIDVLNGKFLYDGALLETLPLRIRENELVQKIFGLSIPPATEVRPGHWELVFQGLRYLISEWGTYFSLVEIYRLVKSEWQCYYPPDNLSDLPFRSLIERTVCWVTNTKIFFHDARTDALIAQGDIHWGAVKEIFEMADKKATGRILRNIYSSDPDYQFLEAFENPNWIMVWQRQGSNEPETLELSRYHLTFQAQKNKNGWEYFSKEYPGYRIATSQVSNALPNINCLLVLENDQTKEKRLLIPELSFNKLTKLGSDVKLDIPNSNTELSFIEYQEDRFGTLSPPSILGKLKLAELMLFNRNYSQAYHFLIGCDPQDQYPFRSGEQLVPFKENELSIIYNILDCKDMSPDAIAIRIKAQLILIRNGQEDRLPNNMLKENDKYITKKDEEYQKRRAEYETFLQHREQTLNPFSSEEEEKLFIDYALSLPAKKGNPFNSDFFRLIQQRYRQLWDLPMKLEPANIGIDTFGRYLLDPFDHMFFDNPFDSYRDQPSNQQSVIRPNIVNLQTFKDLIDLIHRRAFVDLYKRLIGLTPESNWSDVDCKKKVDEILEWSCLSKYQKLANYALYLLTILRNPKLDLRDNKSIANVAKSIRDSLEQKKVAKAPSSQPQLYESPSIQLRPASAELLGEDNPPPKLHQCMLANLPSSFQGTIIQNPEEFFTIIPQKLGDLQKTKVEMDGLLSTKVENRICKEKAALLQQKMNSYFESFSSQDTFSVSQKNLLDLVAKREDLQQIKVDQEKLIKDKKNLILALANQDPKNKTAKSFREVTFASRSNRLLTLQELMHLASANDMAEFHKRNPFLSEKEIFDLFSLVIEYQIQMTNLQQTNRIIQAIDLLVQAKENHAPLAEEASLTEKLAMEMSRKREYDVRRHPEYLNIEIALNCLLRLDQVKNLELLQSDLGIALEAPPGSGKTTVMLTMLAFLNADGEHLALTILPEALMKSQSAELKDRISVFGKRVEVMDFVRTTDFSLDSLERILFRLKDIIRNKKVLVMTNTSLLSFFLTYIEKTIRCDAQSSLKEIHLFRKIFHLLKSSGKATIDEVDFILDVLKAHHFASGSEVPPPPVLLTTITDLYRFLATHELEGIGFSFLHQKYPFTAHLFKTKAVPVIIQAIFDGKLVSDKETAQFIANTSIEQRQWLSRYLSNDPSCNADQFFEGHSMMIKNVFAVLKEEITTLLPLTAKRRVDEHYGAIPNDVNVTDVQRLFAIPYHGNNNPAIIKSEFAKKDDMVNFSIFGTKEETIGYTIQMYLNHGITKEILKKELAQLKEQAIQDLRNYQISPAIEQFYQLAGDQQLSLFGNLSESDLEKIMTNVNQNMPMILDLVLRHVLPELREHSEQLCVCGEIYGALFQTTNGFSATLNNFQSLPDLFSQVHLSKTVEESLKLLWEKGSHNVAVIPNESNLPKLVASVYRDGFTGSFIDIGGLFRGVPNEKVAAEILSYSDKKGIAFYDTEDRRVVLLKEIQKIVPFEFSNLKKDEIIAYWDQSRTRGSDIPLSTMMTAKATFSQHTTLTNLIQGVRRLRQLEFGQRVYIIVSAEDSEIIRATLEQMTGQEIQKLELKDLILYALLHETLQQGNHNYRALHHKWKGYLYKRLMDTVDDLSISDEECVQMIRMAQELFVSKTALNPYDQYGEIFSEIKGQQVVEEELQSFINGQAMQTFATLPILRARYSFEDLKKGLRKITDENLPFIPDKLEKSQKRLGLEVHVEKQQQIEQQTQKQTENENELSGFDNKYTKPRPIISWSLDHLFELATYEPISYSAARQMNAIYIEKQNKRTIQSAEMLVADPALKDFANLFDLEESVNFSPAYLRDSDLEPPCTPLSGAYEEINPAIIIVQEIDTKKLRFILSDQEDAKMVKMLLKQDTADPVKGQRQVRMCLYSLDTGIEQQGSDRFDENALSKDPHFQQLRIQAKFRRGDQYYSQEELSILSSWIKKKGVSLMQRLFMKLSRKPIAQDSNIAQLFKTLN